MSNAAVSFGASVLDDGDYQTVIAQTGPDTASIDIRKWATGADQSQPPASDAVYAAKNVRVLGKMLSCDVSEWFITDRVRIVLSGAGVTPSVSVSVSGIGGFSKVFPLSQADHDAIAAFLVDASFPAG